MPLYLTQREECHFAAYECIHTFNRLLRERINTKNKKKSLFKIKTVYWWFKYVVIAFKLTEDGGLTFNQTNSASLLVNAAFKFYFFFNVPKNHHIRTSDDGFDNTFCSTI